MSSDSTPRTAAPALTEAGVRFLLEHRKVCPVPSLTIREALVAIEAEAATPAASGDALREALKASTVLWHGCDQHPGDALIDCPVGTCVQARAALAASPTPEGLDVEKVRRIIHDRNESSGYGCTHSNGFMRGQDCGKEALMFVAEYDHLAEPEATNSLQQPDSREEPDKHSCAASEHLDEYGCNAYHDYEDVGSCQWQQRCDEPGCKRASVMGTKTPEGYRRTCSQHNPS
jgi:hypothetical protein